MEQKCLHFLSTWVYSAYLSCIHVAKYLVVCVTFPVSLFVFFVFSFDHCDVFLIWPSDYPPLFSSFWTISFALLWRQCLHSQILLTIAHLLSNVCNLQLLLLPNTDRPQLVEDYVCGSTCQLQKVKIIYRCYKLVFARRVSPCFKLVKGPGRLNELDSWIQLAAHTSLSPIRRGFAPGFVNYTKGTLDLQPQAYQLLAHGRWFSPGTPASPTTKTCRHDIAEILLKVALSTINQFKSNLQ